MKYYLIYLTDGWGDVKERRVFCTNGDPAAYVKSRYYCPAAQLTVGELNSIKEIPEDHYNVLKIYDEEL